MGLSTCRVISLRKAENFIFSFNKLCFASLLLLPFSSPFSFSFPLLSLGVVRSSMDLAFRKLPSFPCWLVLMCFFVMPSLVVPLGEYFSMSRFCLVEDLFKLPLALIKGAVSSSSSKYLCFLEMSVKD